MLKSIKSKFSEYIAFKKEEAKYIEIMDVVKLSLLIVVISGFVVLFSYLMFNTKSFGLWTVPFLVALTILYDRFVLIFAWMSKEQKVNK